jgi:hypothetical protein
MERPFFFNRMDFDTLTMDIDMVIPLLRMVADYEMEGKVLILSIRGKGDCILKFSKSQLTLKVEGKRGTGGAAPCILSLSTGWW